MLGLFRDYETDEPEELHNLIQDATGGEIRQHLLSDPWAVQRHDENGLLPIHLVVQRDANDVNELIDLLISHNADVNGRTVIESDTALHVLVKNVPAAKAIHTARKLLSCGADPKLRNKRLRSAYDYAIQKGNKMMLEVLNCDKWHMDQMAIITAVTRGTLEDIQKVIRLGGDVSMKTETGDSPIHYVITHRHKHDKGAVIDLLLQHKANINSQDRDRNTAMHLAIRNLPNDNELYTLVEYLLSMGCDPSIPNKAKQEAIDIAVENDYDDIIELLEGRNDAELKANLFQAVDTGNVKGVQSVLGQDDAAALMFSENGLNPLHVVAMQEAHANQLTMINTLVEGGADVNVQTLKNNDTPLHLAARHDNAEVITRLLECGADPERRNNNGKTPYEEAADREHVESMEALESFFEEKAEEQRREQGNYREDEGRQKQPEPKNSKSGSCAIL